MTDFDLKPLPPEGELETPAVLKELVRAHRYLAELKGVAKTIPNENILIYKHGLQNDISDPVTKEVAHYVDALRLGYNNVKTRGALTLNTILEIQQVLEGNRAGFRKTPGTVLKNERTGQVVFEPPSPEKMPAYMSALESFINEESKLDILVCMALIHHQFETIHPFYDGNGRTGRILNILYLVQNGLLDTPILYLSRYINQSKDDYYSLLQKTRDENLWEEWIIYMLKGVSVTAKHTTALIERIRDLLLSQKQDIRKNYKFYSQESVSSSLHQSRFFGG